MAFVHAASQQPLSLSSCTSNHFTPLEIPGLQLNQIEANVVQGASKQLPAGLYLGHGGTEFTNLDYCNVSVTYSHTGRTEPINVHVYLPSADSWNSRMMAVGGGGWAGGLFAFLLDSMEAGVNDGYVTVGTDGGHDPVDPDPGKWALKEDGQMNDYMIETFFYTCLQDMANIGKAVTEKFYGSSPKHSYFNGCSQGGRQGLALAQRFPEAFDGILAQAPAIQAPELLNMMMWPQVVMDENRDYPQACELAALTAAAIRECDLDDGVADGMLSDPAACKFNAFDFVGKPANCPGGVPALISEGAARAAEAAWTGPTTQDGKRLWYGISHDADLAGMFCIVNTACEEVEGSCHGVPFEPARQWLQYFVAKQREYDHTKITGTEFERIFHQSVSEWRDSVGTANPDLSGFRKSGGKMITVHGISDQVIPVANSKHYYDNVLKLDPKAQNYYRYFEAPGLAHCFGGKGFYPDNVWNDLVAWVEDGQAPDTVMVKSPPNAQGKVSERPMCAYPLVPRYDGTGDDADPNNYHCTDEHLSATYISTIIQRSKKYFTADKSTTKSSRDEL